MSTSYPSLGKYKIIEEIGRGGMGAVYKGYDPFLNRTVAIKLLAPHLVWEKDFIERFMREARAAARLQHSHIIPIHDVGQEGNNYYFVMAYLPGQSLKQRIASHRKDGWSLPGRCPSCSNWPPRWTMLTARDWSTVTSSQAT